MPGGDPAWKGRARRPARLFASFDSRDQRAARWSILPSAGEVSFAPVIFSAIPDGLYALLLGMAGIPQWVSMSLPKSPIAVVLHLEACRRGPLSGAGHTLDVRCRWEPTGPSKGMFLKASKTPDGTAGPARSARGMDPDATQNR
jgi:hypothetical protein